MSDSFRPHESQYTRPPCRSPTPGVHSNSRPLSRWCHPAISSSVVPFSSCPQSLPASESFPMSQLFRWGGQSTGVSGLASALPVNTQDWSPLGWTGWIALQSKGLSRVFSNTTVQKHQFFGTQLSSQSLEGRYFLCKKILLFLINKSSQSSVSPQATFFFLFLSHFYFFYFSLVGFLKEFSLTLYLLCAVLTSQSTAFCFVP